MSKGGTLKLQGENIYPNAYYKVGDIFITTNEENPATRFGGTWQKLPDETFLMTAGSNYAVKSTGGENEHTLTINEIPGHSHVVVYGNNGRAINLDKGGSTYGLTFNSSGVNEEGIIAKAVGGSQPHNNVPKFYSVYVWIRIA